jgi:hypothetical protein
MAGAARRFVIEDDKKPRPLIMATPARRSCLTSAWFFACYMAAMFLGTADAPSI